MKKKKGEPVNLRAQVVRAADEADVPRDAYERALILGQIAGLLAEHPRIAGRVAFKGGAIMHLIDGSPRLSRDLDGMMAVGGRVTEEEVRAALSTPAARRIVKSVGRFSQTGQDGLRFPVIACYPLSGIGEINLSLSIHWGEPLLLDPEPMTVTIRGQKISLLVVARIERIAEKIRAFLDRGYDRDAFDLYYYHSTGKITPTQEAALTTLVVQKIRTDVEIPLGADLLAIFKTHLQRLTTTYGRTGGLVIVRQGPDWATVEPIVRSFARFVPDRKV
jgi:hypothetical protein